MIRVVNYANVFINWVNMGCHVDNVIMYYLSSTNMQTKMLDFVFKGRTIR